jgi:hypothetical protein
MNVFGWGKKGGVTGFSKRITGEEDSDNQSAEDESQLEDMNSKMEAEAKRLKAQKDLDEAEALRQQRIALEKRIQKDKETKLLEQRKKLDAKEQARGEKSLGVLSRNQSMASSIFGGGDDPEILMFERERELQEMKLKDIEKREQEWRDQQRREYEKREMERIELQRQQMEGLDQGLGASGSGVYRGGGSLPTGRAGKPAKGSALKGPLNFLKAPVADSDGGSGDEVSDFDSDEEDIYGGQVGSLSLSDRMPDTIDIGRVKIPGTSRSSVSFKTPTPSISPNASLTSNKTFSKTDRIVDDSTPVNAIMKRIAFDHEWTQAELDADLDVMVKNRLRTVKDLRKLSPQGWKDIEGLLPLTKSLLQKAIEK